MRNESLHVHIWRYMKDKLVKFRIRCDGLTGRSHHYLQSPVKNSSGTKTGWSLAKSHTSIIWKIHYPAYYSIHDSMVREVPRKRFDVLRLRTKQSRAPLRRMTGCWSWIAFICAALFRRMGSLSDGERLEFCTIRLNRTHWNNLPACKETVKFLVVALRGLRTLFHSFKFLAVRNVSPTVGTKSVLIIFE